MPSHPIRVLWLIKGLGSGGAERLLVSSATERNRTDFVYEAAYVLPGASDFAPELEAQGVPVHCLGKSDRTADLRWVVALRRLLVEGRYDILHLHLPLVAGIGRLVGRTLPADIRPKNVATEHNIWQGYALLSRWLNVATYPLNHANLAVSNCVAATLPRHNPPTEVVVYGLPSAQIGLYDHEREAVRAEFGIGPDEVVVGTVANFRAQKGYGDLLKAARMLADRDLPVRFIVIGQGPLEQEIRNQTDALDLGDRFLFTGYRSDALRLLAGFDIFVLASHFEGFPVSVMEAMATGLPIVATAVGGVPDAVRHGVDGLLVPPHSPTLLANALDTLIRDPELRARMAPASRAQGKRFDVSTAVRRTEEVYRAVLGYPVPTR